MQQSIYSLLLLLDECKKLRITVIIGIAVMILAFIAISQMQIPASLQNGIELKSLTDSQNGVHLT